MTLFFIVFAVVELILLIDSERRYVKLKRLMDSDIHDCRVRLEAVEVLSESVRKLNGVVKVLEQKQPKVEPKNRMNTRAFIAGWDADEPEESELLSHIEARTRMAVMDMLQCQNLNPFAQQEIIDNLNCRNIYPWQPLQSGMLQASTGVTYRQ